MAQKEAAELIFRGRREQKNGIPAMPVGQALRLPRLAMGFGVSFGFGSGKALAISY